MGNDEALLNNNLFAHSLHLISHYDDSGESLKATTSFNKKNVSSSDKK